MAKILVIEDEAETRNIFIKCLTYEGFCALEAENGTLGIKLAQTHLPDLVICDIMMPDIDGYGVLAAMRQYHATASIPLIFLTAMATMPDLRQGMTLGADDYLTKPCSLEQFLAAITARLARQAQLRDCLVAHPANRQAENSIFPACPRLSQVFAFIETHYHQPITLSEVAQAAGYSAAYLTNLTQELTGHSVKRWIIERRMLQARNLLRETNQSVRQIAEAIGYADVGYFTRQFRQVHDDSPQSWRRAVQLRSA
ncbi:MAG: response regulator [Oculatellaceae cyanobacterium Prado106]|jgi:YesN/AraC family two-component response regulator|nr:response regulator [Oculatellaceae cyanobacterium Prado106]